MSVRGLRERFVIGVGACALSAAPLVGLVFVVPPLERFVRVAPYVAGPVLWLGLAGLSAGVLSLLGRRPSARAWLLATIVGGTVDVVVVLVVAPWPGLVAGVLAYAGMLASPPRLGRTLPPVTRPSMPA